jgi:putative addiction module killer protein
MTTYQITDYLTEDGRAPLKEWLANLADRQARARVLVRIQRMSAGNFGDCKPLTEGVWELRIDHGPGYRVYYARAGEKLLLLLVGGDKRKQRSDIDTALAYWKDWNRRNAS